MITRFRYFVGDLNRSDHWYAKCLAGMIGLTIVAGTIAVLAFAQILIEIAAHHN